MLDSGLLLKLLQKGVPAKFVKLHRYWYIPILRTMFSTRFIVLSLLFLFFCFTMLWLLLRIKMYIYSTDLCCSLLWNSVLGDSFDILCGVRQGPILSPILFFSAYIDDIICVLRNSGYDVYIWLFSSDAYFMQMILYFCQPAAMAFRIFLMICLEYMVLLGILFLIHVRHSVLRSAENSLHCVQ